MSQQLQPETLKYVPYTTLTRGLQKPVCDSVLETLRAYMNWGDVRHSLVLATDLLHELYEGEGASGDDAILYERLANLDKEVYIDLET